MEVSGNVCNLNPSGFPVSSTHNGASDFYSGVITDEFNRVAGDAWAING